MKNNKLKDSILFHTRKNIITNKDIKSKSDITEKAYIDSKVDKFKPTSIKFRMDVYKALNSLKVESALSGGIQTFVNEAVYNKLKNEFPDYLK